MDIENIYEYIRIEPEYLAIWNCTLDFLETIKLRCPQRHYPKDSFSVNELITSWINKGVMDTQKIPIETAKKILGKLGEIGLLQRIKPKGGSLFPAVNSARVGHTRLGFTFTEELDLDNINMRSLFAVTAHPLPPKSSEVSNVPMSDKEQKNLAEKHCPFPITKWTVLTIEFINGDEIRIKAGSNSVQRSFRDLNLIDSKANSPNVLWRFLLTLARANCELSLDRIPPAEHEKYHQYKRNLTKWLRSYFRQDDDPFFEYREYGSYKPKFIVKPPFVDDETLHKEISPWSREEKLIADDTFNPKVERKYLKEPTSGDSHD